MVNSTTVLRLSFNVKVNICARIPASLLSCAPLHAISKTIRMKEVIFVSDNTNYRNKLRENFTRIENFCKANDVAKNQHQCLSHPMDLMEIKDIENDTHELIKLDCVRANEFDFSS